uniref:Peptidase aspartic putative domain-containing protein n=1 Tax=Timema shepardi TaxID=629360 RepID=A0A7R9B4S6_TIMSH|nr:unnamed protein product [Timema shepardi]
MSGTREKSSGEGDEGVRGKPTANQRVTAGSGRGDNYTATLYRVQVEGKVTGKTEPWSRSLIYKCLPMDPAQREAFKSDTLFKNEVAVYTRALPALMEFQIGGAHVSLPQTIAESLMVVGLVERGSGVGVTIGTKHSSGNMTEGRVGSGMTIGTKHSSGNMTEGRVGSGMTIGTKHSSGNMTEGKVGSGMTIGTKHSSGNMTEGRGDRGLFKAVPQCYLARSDVLVLEDLKTRGFVMVDRKVGLDYHHCKVGSTAIAKCVEQSTRHTTCNRRPPLPSVSVDSLPPSSIPLYTTHGARYETHYAQQTSSPSLCISRFAPSLLNPSLHHTRSPIRSLPPQSLSTPHTEPGTRPTTCNRRPPLPSVSVDSLPPSSIPLYTTHGAWYETHYAQQTSSPSLCISRFAPSLLNPSLHHTRSPVRDPLRAIDLFFHPLHYGTMSIQEISHCVAEKPSCFCSHGQHQLFKVFVGLSSTTHNIVLLATALVHITTPSGNTQIVSAVLDSASQSTLIPEHCAQLLGVKRNCLKPSIVQGISSTKVKLKGVNRLNIYTCGGVPLTQTHSVMINDKITSNMPQTCISADVMKKLKHLVLADPTFNESGSVQMLIGADLFAQTLTGDLYPLGKDMPIALGTIFGFVVMGSAPSISEDNNQPASSNLITLLSTTDIDLHNSLQQFWKLEEPPLSKVVTRDEEICENKFLNTHATDSTVLSAIAQIYDPCGWLTPVIFWAKSLMKLQWTLGISWDDPLPADISAKWAVVSELAHFHALSLSMKRIDPTRFKRDVSDSITEAMFVIENEAWYRDYYKTASRNAIAMVCRCKICKGHVTSSPTKPALTHFPTHAGLDSFPSVYLLPPFKLLRFLLMITEIPASHENIVEEGSRNFKARYVRKEYSEEELPKIH